MTFQNLGLLNCGGWWTLTWHSVWSGPNGRILTATIQMIQAEMAQFWLFWPPDFLRFMVDMYIIIYIYIRIYHDIIIYRYIMVYGRLWYIDLDLWAPKENKHDWKKTMSVGAVQLGTNFTLLLEGTPRLAKVNIELNNSSIQIYSSLTVWLRNEMTWKWWEWIKT